MVTIICVNKVEIDLYFLLYNFVYIYAYLIMREYIHIHVLLVYEGPTADELRSVGLIDIYENAYFMNNLYVYMYIFICTLSK